MLAVAFKIVLWYNVRNKMRVFWLCGVLRQLLEDILHE